MKVTKQQAVEHLIDGAIRAVEAGNEPCAITLAGAAENAMPEPTGTHIFQVTRDAFTGYSDVGKDPLTRKEVVSMLNEERDWLKHTGPDQPNERDLSGGFMAVLRAISKFQAVYGYDAETETMQEYFAEARRFDPHDG